MQEIINLKAEDIMIKRVARIDGDATVMDAIEKLYLTNVGALVVVDKTDKLIGIFTERDLLRRVIPQKLKLEKAIVSKVMTAKPMTAEPQTPVLKVYKAMSGLNFRHIPVVKDDKIVGIISIKDIAKACMNYIEKRSQD